MIDMDHLRTDVADVPAPRLGVTPHASTPESRGFPCDRSI